MSTPKKMPYRKFEHDNNYFHSPPDCEPFTAGYRWVLFISDNDLDALGGRDAFTRSAPVEQIVSVEPTDGSPSPGLAVRLCRDITAISDDLLEAWRSYLAPVLHLAPPSELQPGWIRPVDVLERDWSLPPG